MLGGTSGSQRKGRDPSPPSTSWDLAPPGMLSWAEKPQAALWPFGLCPFMAGIAGHAQGAWQPSGPQEPLQSANGGRGDWEGSTVEIKVPEQECGGLEGPQCPSLLPGPGLPCHPDRDPDPLHAAGQPGRAGPGEQPLSSSFRQSLGSFWLLVWPQLPCPVSGYTEPSTLRWALRVQGGVGIPVKASDPMAARPPSHSLCPRCLEGRCWGSSAEPPGTDLLPAGDPREQSRPGQRVSDQLQIQGLPPCSENQGQGGGSP